MFKEEIKKKGGVVGNRDIYFERKNTGSVKKQNEEVPKNEKVKLTGNAIK